MISNQVLQTTIDGLKNITRIDICVMDTEGKALATTINNVEEYEDAVMGFVDSPADSQVLQGYQFFKVFDEHQLEYVILHKSKEGCPFGQPSEIQIIIQIHWINNPMNAYTFRMSVIYQTSL